MRPFPESQKLAFFKGCTLIQIIVNRSQIDLRFDEGFWIMGCLLRYEQKATGQTFSYDWESRMSPIYFHKVLEEKVTDVSVEPMALSLTFESGNVITICTTEEPYEDGHIRGPDGLIVF